MDINLFMGGGKVRRFLSVLMIFSILTLSVMNVNASDNISFELVDAECQSGRLVEIEIVAACSKKLSAATFEFTYDKNMFEFRSVKSSDSNATIKANETSSNLKAVYLNTYGADISNSATIFTITLKTLSAGTGYLDFSVCDCVDADVNWIDVGKCTSAKIIISGGSSNSNSKNASSSSSSGASSKSSDKSVTVKGTSTREFDTTSPATIDNLGLLNPIKSSNTKYLILGIAVGAALVMLLLLVFFIGKRTAAVKIKNDIKDKDSDV